LNGQHKQACAYKLPLTSSSDGDDRRSREMRFNARLARPVSDQNRVVGNRRLSLLVCHPRSPTMLGDAADRRRTMPLLCLYNHDSILGRPPDYVQLCLACLINFSSPMSFASRLILRNVRMIVAERIVLVRAFKPVPCYILFTLFTSSVSHQVWRIRYALVSVSTSASASR